MNLNDVISAQSRQAGSLQWLTPHAKSFINDGTPAMIVSVSQTRGSAPRECGTLMIVSHANVVGTIGGGHLEYRAIKRARDLLGSGVSEAFETLGLGPSLGQCCGGVVSLNYQLLETKLIQRIADTEPMLFHLNLFGAGHVGRAVVAALANIPCTIRWIDERDSVFPLAVPGVTTVVNTNDPVGEVSDCASGEYYLVMTHSHARDLELVRSVLIRGDAGYLGVIGSKTKRVRFEKRLRALSLDPAQLHCPIGHAGLSGKEPWRIAQSVAADLVQRASAPKRCWRGGDGNEGS